MEGEEPVSLQRMATLIWELQRTIQDAKRDIHHRFDHLEERLDHIQMQLHTLQQEQERYNGRQRSVEQTVETSRRLGEQTLGRFGDLEKEMDRVIRRAGAEADRRLDRIEATQREILRELEQTYGDLRTFRREWRADSGGRHSGRQEKGVPLADGQAGLAGGANHPLPPEQPLGRGTQTMSPEGRVDNRQEDR
ncbi:hypothetical protein [Kyrpidia spormannii]|uniref:Uncharacterized protein n=1 Tax=Kyrpidia spormannii TaxID=2055160 RepID=A0ACA8ZF76_9BACL|nr:hypothetical protein [Kyrpidia spormannii]CAB3395390.1 conserved protein of unknown function [Kyrpidia spormannii]